MTDLEALVASKHWRWLPGMLVSEARMRVGRICTTEQAAAMNDPPLGDYVPDLTDAATLGCLLALVRAALDEGSVTTHAISNGQWGLRDYRGSLTGLVMYDTEGDALAAALLAAP